MQTRSVKRASLNRLPAAAKCPVMRNYHTIKTKEGKREGERESQQLIERGYNRTNWTLEERESSLNNIGYMYMYSINKKYLK